MRDVRIGLLLLSLSCISFPAFADTIHLIDGRSYQGEFIRGDKTSVLFQSGGKTLGFPQKRVSYILFGEGALQMKEKGGSGPTEEIKIIDEKIKTEILRGDSAIFDVTLQAGVDFQKASEGISAVINENKQKNTDTDAFYLGVYFKAWNSFASMIKVIKQWGDPTYSKTISFGERNAQNYFREFRKRQKEMKIDEQTLMAITEVRFDKVKPEIDEWEMKIKNGGEKKK
jgi:hypothetical protein